MAIELLIERFWLPLITLYTRLQPTIFKNQLKEPIAVEQTGSCVFFVEDVDEELLNPAHFHCFRTYGQSCSEKLVKLLSSKHIEGQFLIL